MQTGVLRLSPSGPPIVNDDGGQAVPGDGMQLRLAEAVASTAMAAFTNTFQDVVGTGSTFPGVPVQVLLLAPDPARKYKVNFHVDVVEPTGNADAVQFQLLASYDGGATFPATLQANSHALLANMERTCCLDVGLILGSQLGFPVVSAMPAGSPSIIVKVQGKASTSGRAQIPGNNMCIYLGLAELL